MIPSATADGIEAENYPMTTDELVDRYGDVELNVDDASEQLGDAVGRLDDEVYETPLDVEYAVYAGVAKEAVGRVHYSDRDPMPVGAPHGHDQVSF